jgi:hypothetical protein
VVARRREVGSAPVHRSTGWTEIPDFSGHHLRTRRGIRFHGRGALVVTGDWAADSAASLVDLLLQNYTNSI